VNKFLTRQLKEDVPEIHYRVLFLLLNLSTNPLESIYFKSNLGAKAEENQRMIEIIKKELDLADEVFPLKFLNLVIL
jgi:hypothetical protein